MSQVQRDALRIETEEENLEDAQVPDFDPNVATRCPTPVNTSETARARDDDLSCSSCSEDDDGDVTDDLAAKLDAMETKCKALDHEPYVTHTKYMEVVKEYERAGINPPMEVMTRSGAIDLNWRRSANFSCRYINVSDGKSFSANLTGLRQRVTALRMPMAIVCNSVKISCVLAEKLPSAFMLLEAIGGGTMISALKLITAACDDMNDHVIYMICAMLAARYVSEKMPEHKLVIVPNGLVARLLNIRVLAIIDGASDDCNRPKVTAVGETVTVPFNEETIKILDNTFALDVWFDAFPMDSEQVGIVLAPDRSSNYVRIVYELKRSLDDMFPPWRGMSIWADMISSGIRLNQEDLLLGNMICDLAKAEVCSSTTLQFRIAVTTVWRKWARSRVGLEPTWARSGILSTYCEPLLPYAYLRFAHAASATLDRGYC